MRYLHSKGNSVLSSGRINRRPCSNTRLSNGWWPYEQQDGISGTYCGPRSHFTTRSKHTTKETTTWQYNSQGKAINKGRLVTCDSSNEGVISNTWYAALVFQRQPASCCQRSTSKPIRLTWPSNTYHESKTQLPMLLLTKQWMKSEAGRLWLPIVKGIVNTVTPNSLSTCLEQC